MRYCLAIVVISLSLLHSHAALADKKDTKPANSGFLGDDAVYSQLEEVTLHKGVTGKRWLGPSLNLANFQSVMVEDVQLYPEPKPGPQVSAEVLEQSTQYLTRQLRNKVGSVLNLADAAGPGVLRMETAITGVSVKTEGMKAYEIIPVAALFGAAKAASGKRDRDVLVFVEVRLIDSASDELVGAAMRQIEGEHLKGKKDQLNLDDLKGSLDQATDDASKALSTVFKADKDQ